MRLVNSRILNAALAVVMAGVLAAPSAFAQDPAPVDPPADLQVVDLQADSITLRWTDLSGGLSAFEIQRQTSGGEFLDYAISPAGTTEWTDDAVLPAETYEYRVRAVLDGLPSEYTPAVMAVTLPATPTDLQIAGMAVGSITLQWTDANGGTCDIEVQRRAIGGDFDDVATLPAGATEWADLDVEPAEAFQYRIRAVLNGIRSEYTESVTGSTAPIPPPAAPGTPVVQVLSSTEVSVQWTDLSSDEIAFQVFRGVDGALPVLAASLPAGTTAWTDQACSAERTYAYSVRAVGAKGPSAPSATVKVSTPASLAVEVLRGKRVDSPKFSKDSIDVTVECAALLDPRATELSLGVGAGSAGTLLAIPANDLGWKVKGAVFTWKSPKGSSVKATLVVDTAKGTVRMKIKGQEFGAANAAALRLWIRSGTDAGSVTAPWTVKKAGTLVY